MSHRKRGLSSFEIAQIVHYGARMVSKKGKDNKTLTEESRIIKEACLIGSETNEMTIFLSELPDLMKSRTPEDFIVKLLRKLGIVQRVNEKFSELTILSAIVGDDRRKGSIRRISEVPISEQ